jgi:small subunit ribosomal protein S16
MTRTGRGNRKTYRLIAEDMRDRRDGRALQFLGYFDPFKKEGKIQIKEEAVYAWLKKGAEPSDTVRSMLKKAGIWAKWMLIQQGKDVSMVALAPKAAKKKRKKKRDKGAAEATKPAPAAATAPAATA